MAEEGPKKLISYSVSANKERNTPQVISRRREKCRLRKKGGLYMNQSRLKVGQTASDLGRRANSL